MNFKFDFKERLLKSDDPNIFLKPIMHTRERVIKILFNWNDKKILFDAIPEYQQDKKTKKLFVYWTIRTLSGVHMQIPTYKFKDISELKQVAEIIQEALYQYDGYGAGDNFEVVTVDFSPHVRKALGQGGEQ